MRLNLTRERGSVLVIAMLVLMALLSIAGLAALQVEGYVKSSSDERFKSIADLAAESGLEMTFPYLRNNYHVQDHWGSIVHADNAPDSPASTAVPGNNRLPGEVGNPFDPKLQAWYSVRIFNNVRDPGLIVGNDDDSIIVVESTGYGPNGTVSQIVVELRSPAADSMGRPCPTYGQRGMASDNAGFNACLGQIDYTKRCAMNPITGARFDPVTGGPCT